eukprot:779769-Karenia_brevis.AAC.1
MICDWVRNNIKTVSDKCKLGSDGKSGTSCWSNSAVRFWISPRPIRTSMGSSDNLFVFLEHKFVANNVKRRHKETC